MGIFLYGGSALLTRSTASSLAREGSILGRNSGTSSSCLRIAIFATCHYMHFPCTFWRTCLVRISPIYSADTQLTGVHVEWFCILRYYTLLPICRVFSGKQPSPHPKWMEKLQLHQLQPAMVSA